MERFTKTSPNSRSEQQLSGYLDTSLVTCNNTWAWERYFNCNKSTRCGNWAINEVRL